MTSTRLPLCPRMAEVSYQTVAEGRDQIVSRFVKAEADKRGITITPLSYFVAEFRGPCSEINWLRENYPLLVTEFNPKLVTEDESLYIAAHQHVGGWIRLVDEGKYNQLMFEENNYCPVCCSTPGLLQKGVQPPK